MSRIGKLPINLGDKVSVAINGDTVVVKGKVKSVGEVMGYSIDVDGIE